MTESLRDRLDRALGAAYALERELHGGGMARVFVAEERALGRRVVIKVLEPEFAGTIDADRFRREIGFAARLMHPHLVGLLTAGEIDGVPYYTMPYVPGRTLRERLTQVGAMPVAEVVSVFRDVCRAVAYAHRHGVVHRDLKPENILLSEEGARITDFGIAKAIGASTGGLGPATRTSASIAMGTPAYMAPEQATADPYADHRVDVYALGVLLYEMLAGAPPFTVGTSSEIMRAQVHHDPAPLGPRRPDAPPALAGLAMACLAKRASARPQMADDLLRALDAIDAVTTDGFVAWTAGGSPVPLPRGASGDGTPVVGVRWRRASALTALALAVVAVVAVATWTLLPPRNRAVARNILRRGEARLDERRIVVIPFANRSGDARLAVLGEMAADWLARGLARTGTLEVVDARTAQLASDLVDSTGVLRRRGREVEVAGETGAGLVVTGSFFREGATVHLEARLVDVAHDRTVPLVTVEGPDTARRTLVEALRRRAMGALAPLVNGDRSWSDGMGDPPSYEAFVEVDRAIGAFARGDTVDAFLGFRHAAALDTAYLAPVLLDAYAHVDVGLMERVPAALASARERLREAERRRAGAIPAELLMADFLRAQLDGDANRLFALAGDGLRVLPGSDIAVIAAMAATWAGRPDSALALLSRSDPRRGVNLVAPGYWRWRLVALRLLGRHAEEADAADDALAQFPGDLELLAMRAMALASAGRPADAKVAADRFLARAAVEPSPRALHATASLVQALQAASNPDAARVATEGRRRLAPGAVGPRGAAAAARLDDLAGDSAAARVALLRISQDRPGDLDALGGLGLLDARAGRTPDLAALDRAVDTSDGGVARGQAALWRARIRLALGDVDGGARDLVLARSRGATFGNPFEAGLGVIETLPEVRAHRDHPAVAAALAVRR